MAFGVDLCGVEAINNVRHLARNIATYVLVLHDVQSIQVAQSAQRWWYGPSQLVVCQVSAGQDRLFQLLSFCLGPCKRHGTWLRYALHVISS